jgi:uncharacterized protein involved in response to NO
MAIKFSVLLAVFSVFMPATAAALVLGTAALLMLARIATWFPNKGLRDFGIAIMYIGHFALIVHLGMEAAIKAGVNFGNGTLSTHVFTFLTMGVIIPGMLIRISHGHTGRKIVFTLSDRVAFLFMGIGACARLLLTQIFPEQYALWIASAGALWALCFATIGLRIAPFLWQARVDGKTH